MDVKHLSLTALFLTIAISCSQQKKWNVANSGVANLFAADFASGKIYELNGEWEYHPGRLLDPNAMSQLTTEKKYAHVPQSFNSYENPALQLPEKAVATYRLEIILPPKIATYTLRIPPILSASRIYVNGQLEITNGQLSEDLAQIQPTTRVHYLQLPLAGHTELLIQVANAHLDRGGIVQPITIGLASAMEKFRIRSVMTDVFVSVAMITFAIYYIMLFFLNYPEKSSFYYGIFCLLVGSARLFTGEHLIDSIFALGWETKYRLTLCTNLADTVFFALYVRNFFTTLQNNWLVYFIMAMASLFSLAAIVLPSDFIGHLWQPFTILIAISIPIAAFYMQKLVKNNVYGAKIFFVGIIILGGTFVSDVARDFGIHSLPYLFSYASFIFTFLQAILISGKTLRLYQENKELSQRLLKLDKMRSEFLSHAAHELRTPLHAMVQTLQNIRDGTSGALNEEIQKKLAIVEDSGKRLAFIVDDLEDFMRLKHGNLRLEKQQVNLYKTIDPVLQLALGLTENNKLVIVNEVPPQLPAITTDPSRLQQILLNLLNVAIRHSHTNTIVVKPGIINDQIALQVIYHGQEPEPPYQQSLDPEAEHVVPLVVQKLTELLGGEYLYHRFTESQHALVITLPCADIRECSSVLENYTQRTEHRRQQLLPPAPSAEPVATPRGTEALLIVGEQAGQNKLLQEQLAQLGKPIVMAKNGAEALLMLQSRQDIGLVVADMLLPDVSGIELTQTIRSQYETSLLPILLIIDANQPGIAASAFAAGANDLIRRPLEKTEVVARVRNLLQQREAIVARENFRALNRELEIARSIQESLIPAVQPKSNMYKIEAVCLPARSIGGDFYDFIEDDNFIAVLIADVAGHGIPAALYASMLKIAFHNLRSHAQFPEKLLRELNTIMYERGDRTFISCAYTLVDFRNRRLLHTNAGHLPLLMQLPGNKTIERLQPPGGVLGIRRDTVISVEMRHLQPGTRLMLYTDGLIELVNRRGELFEEKRLMQILQQKRQANLAELKEELLTAMREFSEGENFPDDVTFILLDT